MRKNFTEYFPIAIGMGSTVLGCSNSSQENNVTRWAPTLKLRRHADGEGLSDSVRGSRGCRACRQAGKKHETKDYSVPFFE